MTSRGVEAGDAVETEVGRMNSKSDGDVEIAVMKTSLHYSFVINPFRKQIVVVE